MSEALLRGLSRDRKGAGDARPSHVPQRLTECEAASVERVSVLLLRLLDPAYERVLPVTPTRRVSSHLPLALPAMARSTETFGDLPSRPGSLARSARIHVANYERWLGQDAHGLCPWVNELHRLQRVSQLGLKTRGLCPWVNQLHGLRNAFASAHALGRVCAAASPLRSGVTLASEGRERPSDCVRMRMKTQPGMAPMAPACSL